MTKTSEERVEAALEAAWLAHDNACPGEHWRKRARMEVAIKAYLSALSAADAVKTEPVAWCQPRQNGEHSQRMFIVRFEDADKGDAVFDNEVEAREFWQKANDNWNCYLFGSLPLSPPTSELEALREELHLMKTAGIIEVAVRNPSVSDYMNHWEKRAETAEARLAEAMKALDEALVGLDAGCSQYVNRTISGAEVPGDEQYPWVRLMQIGRDAVRRVREGGKVE